MVLWQHLSGMLDHTLLKIAMACFQLTTAGHSMLGTRATQHINGFHLQNWYPIPFLYCQISPKSISTTFFPKGICSLCLIAILSQPPLWVLEGVSHLDSTRKLSSPDLAVIVSIQATNDNCYIINGVDVIDEYLTCGIQVRHLRYVWTKHRKIKNCTAFASYSSTTVFILHTLRGRIEISNFE